MPEITDRSPVLILPHADLKRSREMDPDQGVAQGVARQGFEAADSFRRDAWTLLASRYGELMREFMMRPYDASVLEAMQAVVRAGASVSGGEAASLQGKEGWVDVSTTDPALLLSSVSDSGRSPRFRIMYESGSNAYRVFWNRSPEAGDGVSNLMEHGAWILSSLNGAEMGLRRILSDSSLVDSVLNGARILYVPQDAGLVFPRLLPLARSSEGKAGVYEFWTPELGQTRGRGKPPIAYRVTSSLREMLNVKDLIAAIEREMEKARAMGKEPAIALDLDGTLIDARKFAARIFNEWLQSYDGPDAAEIREKAKGSDITRGWNSLEILEDDLGVKREETLKDADAYFQANFYNAERRLEMLAIEGMKELVQLLMKMGLKNVYVTLRSSSDDTLPDGGSSSKQILGRYATWNEGSVLLRHEGEKITWSKASYLAGVNEPPKWAMIKAFRKKNPGVYFVAVADNAPAHVKGYREFFEYSVINIHVKGDNPPNSPSLPDDAIFEVDPDRLALDLAGWMEGCVRKGRAYASEAIHQLSKIYGTLRSVFYMDYPEKHAAEIKSASIAASRVLDSVVSINPLNAIYSTFVGEINAKYANEPGELENFEDLLGVVNQQAGTSYAVIRGPGGVERIFSSRKGGSLEDAVPRPAPAYFTPSRISLKKALTFNEIEKVLLDMPAGPDLNGPIAGESFDRLSFGEFPRMTAALRTAVTYALRDLKMPANRLKVLEYGPRIALGTMITLARMGVSVGWRELNELKKIQTRHELMRVPAALREKMTFIPKKERFKADVSIWNLPHAGTTLKTMTKGMRSGGLVIVQSVKGSAEYQKEGLGHRLKAEITLPSRQYVLPTAFMNSISQVGRPLSFQVWRVR